MLLFSLVVSICANSEFVDLRLKSGPVTGVLVHNHTVPVKKFLGIPFAEPPVGDLRWAPPQEPRDWLLPKPALTYSKSCEQSPNAFTDFTAMSEDCLYLNVWIPAAATADEKLPVMIFYYGGSWNQGSAMFPLYNGERISSRGNVIVVVANYRLNAFGYLGSAELQATALDGSTGNFGTQDQRMVMQWVHTNAAALHADVTRLMIFGESAGAGSVSNHLVHPRSFPFFTRAAMESGPFADWVAQNMSVAQGRFNVFAQHAGCLNHSRAAVVACLRSKNTSEVNLARKGLPSTGLCDWTPVIDGKELTAHPAVLASQGKFTKVPVLLGTNKDEGTLLMSGIDQNANETEFAAWAKKVVKRAGSSRTLHSFVGHPFSESAVLGLLRHYPCSAYKASRNAGSCWWAAAQMFGDEAMTCAARRSARWLSSSNGTISNNATAATAATAGVFLYFFKHVLAATEAIELASGKPMGVFHGSELALVFSFDELLLTDKERALANQTIDLWTSFARNGQPAATRTRTERDDVYKLQVSTAATRTERDGDDAADVDVFQWPAWSGDSERSLELDVPLAVQEGFEHAICDMWDAADPPAGY